MIRYMPPKSSIWGHSMRRKTVAEFHRCVEEFIAEAVHEFKSYSNIMFFDLPADAPDTVRGFEDALRSVLAPASVPTGTTYRMVDTEFDSCLDLFRRYEKVTRAKGMGVRIVPPILTRYYDISSWKFAEDARWTSDLCQLNEGYGYMQVLGTSLAFSSVDEYQWVKDIVKRVFGLALNDKHARPRSAFA